MKYFTFSIFNLGKKAELKKYMKKVMPFVAFMQERVDTVGVSALDTSLPWDETDVLVKNNVNRTHCQYKNLAKSQFIKKISY